MDPTKKRRSKRLPFRKRVKYGNKAAEYTGHTLNLSRHGTVIEASKMFPEGTPLIIEITDNLQIDSSSGEPITLIGKVVWSVMGIDRRGKMGIEFLTYRKELDQVYESKVN